MKTVRYVNWSCIIFFADLKCSFPAHKLSYSNAPCEAWAVALQKANTAFSGGEDGLLKMWDLRCNSVNGPININRTHGAGVTLLKVENEEMILSGSYDEQLRRFDTRRFNDPVISKQVCFLSIAVFLTVSTKMCALLCHDFRKPDSKSVAFCDLNMWEVYLL